MGIKRVRLENISSSKSYTVFSNFWFYDKYGVRFDIGDLIKNNTHLQETTNTYLEHYSAYDASNWSLYYGMNSKPEFIDGQYKASLSNSFGVETFAQAIFKTPLEYISKFEIDIHPRSDGCLSSAFYVKFFDENDNLLISYRINPKDYFYEKTQYRKVTIQTPELNEKPKYMVLSEPQDSGGTKNYVIEKRYKEVIPTFHKAEFDDVVAKYEGSPPETEYHFENVFMGYPPRFYQYHTYFISEKAANGMYNPYIAVRFNEPKMIVAMEYQSYTRGTQTNLNFVIEAYDESKKQWVILHNYDVEVIPEYSTERIEFENHNFYFRYRIRFIKNGTGVKIQTNGIRLYESENILKEVSITNENDYKAKGMRVSERIETNNIKKAVTQSSKVPLGVGSTFAKRFNKNADKIRSITV